MTPRQVDYEDVDDIIGIACELKEADEGKLTVEELAEVATELDLPREYVERALTALEARREEAKRRAETQKRLRRRTAMALAALLAAIAVASVSVANGLRADAVEVTRRRAQVRNVLERRAAVQVRVAGRSVTRDIEAELSGADNRVAVETRRYDEAAAAYNARASAFPASLLAGTENRPDGFELSREIATW